MAARRVPSSIACAWSGSSPKLESMRWYTKTMLGLLALLLVALAGYLAYARFIYNPEVVAKLRAAPDSTYAGRAMLLHLPDGRVLPVNYLLEGDTVFVGVDGRWWRLFEDGGAPVTLEIRGQTLTGHATVVLDDPAYTHDVFSRLRPTAPAWLPDWLNGKLVVISLNR